LSYACEEGNAYCLGNKDHLGSACIYKWIICLDIFLSVDESTSGFDFFLTHNFMKYHSNTIWVCGGGLHLQKINRQLKESPLSLVVFKCVLVLNFFSCIETALLYGFSSVW